MRDMHHDKHVVEGSFQEEVICLDAYSFRFTHGIVHFPFR